MNKQFEVYSVDESGIERYEGYYPTEFDAYQYSDWLAKEYGPTEEQDLDRGHRIVKISYRPVWILKQY